MQILDNFTLRQRKDATVISTKEMSTIAKLLGNLKSLMMYKWYDANAENLFFQRFE